MITPEKADILISACLYGAPVRYDGRDNLLEHALVSRWKAQGRLLPCCPELAGGLTTPRPAAEIINGDGAHVLSGQAQVKTRQGIVLDSAFIIGAQATLKIAQDHDIRFALLKANSPSCGNQQIYDGQFSGQLIDGAGVTATLLQANGIQVFNEHQIDLLELALQD